VDDDTSQKRLHKTGIRKEFSLIEISAVDLNRYVLEEGFHQLNNLIREVDNGTLVVTHLEQLSAESQHVLADLIQYQRYQPHASLEEVILDIRIIGLSKGALEHHVLHGEFREDLYQRLKVMPIDIPALRQHTEDIPELVEYFVEYFVTREGLEYRHFSVPAQNALRQYGWRVTLKSCKI